MRKRPLYIYVIGIAVAGACGYVLLMPKTPTPTPSPVATSTGSVPTNTYGMSEYTDSINGFSFWYPGALQVAATTTEDRTSFPGGVAVETLQIGSMGDTSIFVVDSPSSTITDEAANHASPIAQTEYFYDSSLGQWMVAFPQGRNDVGSSAATTTADISKTTMADLFMFPSGRRFDTTIVPLSTTRFLVITDGGGSTFTSQLARTVAPVGASIDPSAQSAALQAEEAAYAQG